MSVGLGERKKRGCVNTKVNGLLQVCIRNSHVHPGYCDDITFSAASHIATSPMYFSGRVER